MKTSGAFPPTEPPLRLVSELKLKSVLFPVALNPSSSHQPHSLPIESPRPVLHRFPQAHIARNPITSQESKPTLMCSASILSLFQTHISYFPLNSSYQVKEDAPWVFALRHVTRGSVSHHGPLSGCLTFFVFPH